MTDNNGKVRPFGIKDKLGYMFGDFGNDFTFVKSISAVTVISLIYVSGVV